MIFEIVCDMLHLQIKDDVTLMRILSVLIGKAWIVQATIGSKVTREVAQIAPLVWMVGKHPMLHRYMSKVKKQEVLSISSIK